MCIICKKESTDGLEKLYICGEVVEFSESLVLSDTIKYMYYYTDMWDYQNNKYNYGSQSFEFPFHPLKVFPKFPLYLTNLEISRCNIKILPDFPITLEHLYISGCYKLESLPNLPQSLKTITISSCRNLRTLPELPQSLKELKIYDWHIKLYENEDIYSFGLTSLPELPQSLELFVGTCMHKITSLPDLPQSLKRLDCNGCSKLTLLPDLPQSLNSLDCGHCNNLLCISKIPTSLKYIYSNYCKSLMYISSNYVNIPLMPYIQMYIHNCFSLNYVPDNFYKNNDKSREYIEANYCKWRKEQTLYWFSSTRGVVYEELIRKTWHPSRIIDWCWDTEEVKWFKSLS